MVRKNAESPYQLVLHSSASPKTIDLIHEQVAPSRGIYELRGDTLTIVWGPPGGDRPTKFAGARMVHTWKRIDRLEQNPAGQQGREAAGDGQEPDHSEDGPDRPADGPADPRRKQAGKHRGLPAHHYFSVVEGTIRRFPRTD